MNTLIGLVSVEFLANMTLLFIALKLLDYIKWSWVFVFAPIWAPVLIAFIVGVIAYGVSALIVSSSETNNDK